MAEFPAMPLFTDAYLADTRHLTTEEHGAYLLLLMEAWRRPKCDLPDDDRLLSRLTGLPIDRWQEIKPIVMAFWKRDGRSATFRQKRLSAERIYVADKTKMQRDRAAKRWNKTKKDDAAALPDGCQSDAPTPTPTPTSSSLRSEDIGGGGGSARDREKSDAAISEGPTFREQILAAIGVDPSGLTGRGGTRIGTQADMIEANRWISDLGLSEVEVLAEVASLASAKQDGPPSRFSYFTQAMQRLAAAKAAPPPTIPAAAQPRHASARPQTDVKALFARAFPEDQP